MGPFVLAWMVGETIIIYRTAKAYKAPPGPGQLLLSSGLFGLLSLIAESDKGRLPATIMAWGINLAAFMNLFPGLPTAAGQAMGKVGSQVVSGKAQQWPPSPAANTVVIPDGTSASAQASLNGSQSLQQIAPYKPNLIE